MAFGVLRWQDGNGSFAAVGGFEGASKLPLGLRRVVILDDCGAQGVNGEHFNVVSGAILDGEGRDDEDGGEVVIGK